MEANIDMNSNRVINLPTPISASDAVRLIDLQSAQLPSVSVLGLANVSLDNVTPITGRMSLGFGDSVSVMDYGAVGDGVTNDGPAFALASMSLKPVFVPWTSTGYNTGTTQIEVHTGQVFWSDKETKILSKVTGTNGCFLLSGYDQLSGIENFEIDMTGSGISSAAIKFNTDVAVVWRTYVNNVRIKNHYNGIIGTTGHYIVDNRFNNVTFTYSKGPSVYIPWSQGFQRWFDINIDDTLAWTGAYATNWTSFEYIKFAGVELYRVDNTGQGSVLGAGAAYNANVKAYRFLGTGAPVFNAFVWFDRVRSESSTGVGFDIDDINFIHMHWVEVFTPIGEAINIAGSSIIIGNDVYVRGSRDQVGTVASNHGLTFSSTNTVSMSNVGSEYCTGDSIRLIDSSNVYISAVRCNFNIGWDIIESGTSNNNNFSLCSLSGTGLGKSSLVGATTHIIEVPGGLANANTWTGINNFSQSVRVNNTIVLGSRVTGFTNMTGTTSKAALATYTAGTASVGYVQAELQAVMTALQALSQRVKAHDDAMYTSHGLIGA